MNKNVEIKSMTNTIGFPLTIVLPADNMNGMDLGPTARGIGRLTDAIKNAIKVVPVLKNKDPLSYIHTGYEFSIQCSLEDVLSYFNKED